MRPTHLEKLALVTAALLVFSACASKKYVSMEVGSLQAPRSLAQSWSTEM